LETCPFLKSVFGIGFSDCSDSVHAGGKSKLGVLFLTALIPVVKVVSTVFSAGRLPLENAFGLVLDDNALLELGVVILAGVTVGGRDKKGVKFVSGVLPRHKFVGGNANVVVKESHFFN